MQQSLPNPNLPNAADDVGTELEAVLRNCRSAFVVVILFSLVINVLMLVPSVYMLQVMDRVLSTGHVETLLFLTIIAAAAALAMSMLETLRGSVMMRIASWLNDRMGPVFLGSGVRARLKGDYSGGQTLRDLSIIQGFIATQGLVAFFDAPWVPVFLIIIWMLHPMLGGIAVLCAAVLFGLSLVNDWVTRRASKEANLAQLQASMLADTTIRNAEVVHAMGMLAAMVGRWQVVNTMATLASQRAGEASGIVMAVTRFVRSFVQMAMLGAGAYLVVKSELSPGGMIASSILLGRALAPVEMLMSVWKGYMEARIAYDRLQLHLKANPPEPTRTLLPPPRGELFVRNLTFYAPGNGRPIVDRVNFAVMPGEAVAIIGPSGAGKSSLCRLIVGLAPASQGDVRIDGSDLRHWASEELGRHIGFLPQDVELFAGTVRENIARMGAATDDAVTTAANAARAHGLIQHLPDGYDTHIGDGGIRLSGGQRQRVGLARAVFGDPTFIVLDEPNANLDQAGESALAEAIQELKARGKALIIVGHRPSTLAQADKILLMKDGAVVMFGPRDEVLNALSASSAHQSANSEAVPIRKAPPANDQHAEHHNSQGHARNQVN